MSINQIPDATTDELIAWLIAWTLGRCITKDFCGSHDLVFAEAKAGGAKALECRRCEATWIAPQQLDPSWRRR